MNLNAKEYDFDAVQKRSKKFLKDIIGKEKFDKLQKDGKIEFEVENKSGIIVYELYSDGRVINKTKNQSYCLVSDRLDYPNDDMVAIKYAWLVHESDIAEKVANKTNLHTGFTHRARGAPTVGYGDFVREMEQRGWDRQQVNIDTINHEAIAATPWYGDYVDYLTSLNWSRELTVLDQNNTSLVATSGVGENTTGTVVDVRCPAGMKMSIMGTQQIPRGADTRVAYSLGLYITDDNGEEIPDETKMRVTKLKPSEDVIQLARIFYQDIKMIRHGEDFDTSYRFRQGIELNGEDHLTIYIINSPKNIPSENIRFKIEADLWAMN